MRMLLKLATSGAAPIAEAKLGAAGSPLTLRHLFAAGSVPPRPGVAPVGPASWYVAEAGAGTKFGASSAHPWDLAHSVLRDGLGLAGAEVLRAEPDLEQGWV